MSQPLTSRQEAFARQFCATGNAAESARRAGYAAGSARQTGHDLLNRPWVIERIRIIRAHWRRTARSEAAILLARLEQAWDAAVAANEGRGAASQMLQVIRLQADIAGLTRRGQAARADLWPMPDGDRDAGDLDDDDPDNGDGREPPLAAAVRQGREQAERALADHRRERRALQGQSGFDVVRHLQIQRRLQAAINARLRVPSPAQPVARSPGTGLPAPAMTAQPDTRAMTYPDKSLHTEPAHTEPALAPDLSASVEPAPDAGRADNAITDAAEAGWLAAKRASGGKAPGISRIQG